MVHRGILDLKRFQSGERFSSCLPESTVNAVINKSFAKRQQIQWHQWGTHLRLQTRTRTLDGTLRPSRAPESAFGSGKIACDVQGGGKAAVDGSSSPGLLTI